MNQPIRRFKAGPCSASVFANEIADGEGRVTVHSVSVQRSYRDRNGEFQHTGSLRTEDLPRAALLLCRAYAFLMDDEQAGSRRGDARPGTVRERSSVPAEEQSK